MEIKGYHILEELSRGPITTVFRADQIALDRQVLLKVLNIQWNQDAEFVERFRREARISAKLNHPNIAAIFDFGLDEDRFYIAMEYVNGQTLKQLIEASIPPDIPIILNLTRQICSGLSFAHLQGVVHRDIKPANILLSDTGNLKITDFGLATVTDLPSITEQGTGIGTPAYMSPEQALGKRTGTHSDLFSLGATLYELSTGTSPFRGATVAETITNVTRRNPPPVSALNHALPAWYGDFVAQLLDKDPAKRPASLEPFLMEIELQESHSNASASVSAGSSVYSKRSAGLMIPSWRLLLPVLFAFALILYLGMSAGLDQENGIKKWSEAQDTLPLVTTPAQTSPDPATGQSSDIPPKQEQQIALEFRSRDVPEAVEAAAIEPGDIESRLYIICVPWAEVFIDGKYIDTTPMTGPVRLSRGEHIVELRNPNFRSFRQQITVSGAESETLNVALRSNDGYLMIQAVPWAEIYLNDTYFETTPLRKPIQVAAGAHILRLTNPGFQMIIDTIYIEPGQQIDRKYKF